MAVVRATADRARPLATALSTVLLATLAAACSAAGPPAPSAPPSSAPASDRAALCGAIVDVLRVLDDGPDLGDTPPTPDEVTTAFAEFRARLEPPLSTLEHNPPPVVQADIGTLARQARFAIDNRDVAALETPESELSADHLRSYVVRDCGYSVLRVTSTDFAYAGLPPTTKAGITVFALVNRGTEPHQLTVFRIDDAAQQPFAEIIRLPEAERDQLLDQEGQASANPGSADTIYVTLLPGRYGVACLRLRGSTPELDGTGPPHAELGEFAEFSVT